MPYSKPSVNVAGGSKSRFVAIEVETQNFTFLKLQKYFLYVKIFFYYFLLYYHHSTVNFMKSSISGDRFGNRHVVSRTLDGISQTIYFEDGTLGKVGATEKSSAGA